MYGDLHPIWESLEYGIVLMLINFVQGKTRVKDLLEVQRIMLRQIILYFVIKIVISRIESILPENLVLDWQGSMVWMMP